MAIEIIVTTAGRAALVNAVNTGTNAVTITQLGVTAAVFVPNAAQVALPGEIKRIASVAGVVVADDQIHVTASDVTTDAYTMRGFALYLDDGTLFAIYGQAGEILNKTAESMMLLAADIAFADIDAELIEFGDTNFVLPPATTEILGLVELATTAEAQAGSDATRVLTAMTGKQSVLGWLLSQDGSGSGLDADLLDGLHASAFALAGHTHGTMAAQNANAVNITGGAIDGVTLSNIAGSVGIACAALASTKLQVRIGADRRFSVFANGADNVFGYLTDAGNWADTFMNGSLLRFGIGGTERARFDANGLFGINVAPAARLHVKGTIAETFRLETPTARGGGNLYQSWYDPTGRKGYFGYAGANDNLNLTNELAGDILFSTNSTERMRILSNGNIGLGINAPTTRLDVLNSAAGDVARFSAAGSQALHLYTDANTIGLFNVAGAGAGRDGFRIGADVVAFDINATEIIKFNTSGSLMPIGRYHSFFTTDYGVGTPNASGMQIFTGSADRLRIGHMDAGAFTDRLLISNIGHVGIGLGNLVDAAARLHVKSSGEVTRFETTTVRGAGGLYQSFYDATGRKGYMGWVGDEGLHFINEMNNGILIQTNGFGLTLQSNGNLRPNTDNAQDFGAAGNRWANGHFGVSVKIAGNNAWHAGNDGSGSGLDADLLDGQHGAYYLPAASYTAADVLAKLLGVDGTGSALDADTVDGLHAAALVKYADFTGANQSLGSSGYQKLPGGLIIQWGTYFVGANTSVSATFPIAFPNACLFATTSGGRVDTAAQDNNPFVSGANQYAATIYASTDVSTSGGWIAIGY